MSGSVKQLALLVALLSVLLGVSSCGYQQQQYNYGPDVAPRAVVKNGIAVTLRDQKMLYFQNGKKVKEYPISTSKFGIGMSYGSNRTPLGVHAVTRKVGDGQPVGMVFKAMRATGEVVSIDAAGRDPIVTRVIELAGVEKFNGNSHVRRIYIHGTPEERKIGKPVSYGCIRMKSKDVLDLYSRVHRGTPVVIERCSSTKYLEAQKRPHYPRVALSDEVIAKLPKQSYSIRPRPSSKKRTSSKRPVKRSSAKKATAKKR